MAALYRQRRVRYAPSYRRRGILTARSVYLARDAEDAESNPSSIALLQFAVLELNFLNLFF